MKNILITGPPGIGKTTLVKKIVNKLNLLNVDFDGFYTEEVRNNNYRIGFDIVTLNGKRAILARKSSGQTNMPSVGQYAVHLNEFENLALPVFERPKQLLIIDEIGKMEMFSKKFQDGIKKVVGDNNVKVVATVPLKGGPVLVKQLKEDKDSHLITVNQTNRDHLLDEIVNLIIN